MTAVTNAEIESHIATGLGHNLTKTKAKNKVIVLKPKSKIDLSKNNKRLDEIIDKIVQQHESMRETFTEYCKAALEEGFAPKEAWNYIKSRLEKYVPFRTLYRWAEKDLPLEAKQTTRPKAKKIAKWQSSESERYQEGNDNTNNEEDEERSEIYQISLSDAKPEDVAKYDAPALRRLLKEALLRIAALKKEKGI